MALRMPISRVRSVTDTSMIFIMPMPPTKREMAAMAPKKMVMVPVVSCIVLISAVKLRTEKSFSAVAAK